MDDDLNTGGINLNLLFPVTVDGKTYRYLDQNGNGVADTGDVVTHIALNDLLHGSGRTEATQEGVHNGQDDARSVIVGDTVVILPTLGELMTLRTSLSDTAPANWQNPSSNEYWTANQGSNPARLDFFAYRFSDGVVTEDPRGDVNYTAFQVRTLPMFSTGIDSPQTYTVGQTVTLTLPEADGGVGTLSYTLARDDGSALPAGLSFDPVARTISGMPSEPFGDTTGARMRYTATDITGSVRDIFFRLRVVAAPTFGTESIADQHYTADTAINLTLPVATGGIIPLTYTLTPTASIPAWLTFATVAGARTLIGMPTTATAAVTLTYSATDANGVAATATFSLTGSVPVIAVSAPNGFYMAGERVLITVTFSETVTVSGMPQLALTTGNSDGTGTADYDGGSGTAALTFAYSVRDGDNIGAFRGDGSDVAYTTEFGAAPFVAGRYLDDLAYTATAALVLNSGTIRATIAADLTLPAPGADNSLSHSSDVVLDTIAPTVNMPDATMPTPVAVTADGERIHIAVSEVLTLTNLESLDGDEFTLEGGTAAVVQSVITIPNTQLLILTVSPAIQPGETVTLNWTAGDDGDSMTDVAGNPLEDFTGLSVVNDLVPAVVFVALEYLAPLQNKAGDTVSVVVTFTSSVTVTGIPQLTLDVDGAAGSAVGAAQYASGSPGAALTFHYTVLDGQNTDALGYASVNALGLNGGTIQSTADSGVAADLTLPEPGALNSLSGSSFFPVVFDTIAPAVPVIDDPIAGDNRISMAERNADDGVLITGSYGADSSITLCFGATTATDPLCAGGLTYDAVLTGATTFAPGWSYELDAVDITDIGGGGVTLTAIATDAAGNTAVSLGRSITVDAFVPGIDGPIAGDNIINAAERDFIATSLTTTGERRQTDGVLITGTHDHAATHHPVRRRHRCRRLELRGR